MKQSVKLAERDETPDYLGPEYLGKPQRPIRGEAGNPFAAARPPREDAPPEPGRKPDIDDLVGELEAALMADLDHMATMMNSDAADELRPAPFHAETPAEPEDEETLDGEALQRLMASIRQPVAKPQQPIEPQQQDDAADADHPPLRPSAPLPPAGNASLRGSRSEARRIERGRRVQSSLIVGATLVALAGGGAFMTVQSVTAHDDTGPARVASAEAVPVSAAITPDNDATSAVAKTEERAAPAADAAPADPAAMAPMHAAADPGAGDAAAASTAARETEAPGNTGAAALAKSDLLFAPPAAEAAPPPAVADAAPAGNEPQQKLALADPEPVPSALKAGAPKTGEARIVSGVKLRSNPDNGAPVIGLLKTGDNVTVIACKGWCEVVAGDKRGFVFQKFLAKGG